MPARNDGNEPIFRIRRGKSLPTNGPISGGQNPGTQTDVPTVDDTPNVDYTWVGSDFSCDRGGYDPLAITQLIVRILKGHFGRSENIRLTEIQDLVWSDQPSTRRLWIGVGTDSNPSNDTPSIVVTIGDQVVNRLGVRDEVRSLSEPDRSHHAVAIGGKTTITVNASTDGQTQSLAVEVFSLFICLAPVIAEQTELMEFKVGGMSGLTPDENGGTFTSGVVVEYVYEFGWDMERTQPLLQRISVR